MRVAVHPADQGGCGHYRLIFPARALAEQGHDVELQSDRKYRAVFQPSVFGDRIVDLDEDVDADVVVIQRPLHRHRYELMKVLQTRGHAVVVEVDDDFHSVHRKNPAWWESHPIRDKDSNRDWLMRACEIADLVTVSTPSLAERYGAHGRVAVLPNLVPASYLDIERPGDGRVIVGWSGSTHTHVGDLEVTKGGVGRAVDASDATFAVVGTGVGVRRALDLTDDPVSAGWVAIDEYPHALATFDVGIVPLRLSHFNEAKSSLKMSEMAAVGVAPVGSPTGPNRELVMLGAGLLAETPDDWYRTVRDLCLTASLREDVAGRAREVMRLRTYEEHAEQWWHAWARAADRTRVAA